MTSLRPRRSVLGKCAAMALFLALVSGCSDPFKSDVEKSKVIFRGKDFEKFEMVSGFGAKETRELVDRHIKSTGTTILPIGSCVFVDNEYFFATEERNKLGSLSLNGYYVDPSKQSVVLKFPNSTYYP